MREAMVICPQYNNDGAPLHDVREAAMRKLVAAFGGCSVVEARGAWNGPDGKLYVEPVWQLVTACEDNDDTRGMLVSVADYIGRMGKQLAVYVRFASGDVEIIDTPVPSAAAA